jgi:hypothetical protein
MAAIAPEDWARIWAHAWLDENFKKTLRRNPVVAVEAFQQQFPLSAHDKLFDLDEIYKEPFDQEPFKGMSFINMSLDDLREIAAKGTLHDKPFCVRPNEWVIV